MTEVVTVTVTVPDLLSCLVHLESRHKAAGRISHAQGVRSAIGLIKRHTAKPSGARRAVVHAPIVAKLLDTTSDYLQGAHL
jgi:hypothetical protein